MQVLKFTIDAIVYSMMLVNLKYLTSKYLMYECDNNCAPYFPVTLHTPMLSLCFDWIEVVRLRDNETNWSNLNLSTTFDEWLSLMPDPSQLIDSCAYRNTTLDLMTQINSSLHCAQFLAVTRYRMQGYLCYKFQLLGPETYSYHTIVNSLYNPRQLFALTLHGAITKLSTFYPIIHLSSYPDFERTFERPKFKKQNAIYHLSYGIYESHGVPPPYESRCIDWTPSSCFQQCMDIFLEPHNLVSDVSLVVEYSMDSYRGLMPRGSPLTKQVQDMHATCHKRCKFNSCLEEMVATGVSPPGKSGDQLTLIVESLARPIAKIQQIPKYLFYDFATQVFSLIGIWVGINFTTISILFKGKSDQMMLVNIRVNLLLQSVCKTVGVQWYTQLTNLTGKLGVKCRKRRNAKIRLLVLDLIISVIVFCLFGLQLINVLKNYFGYTTTIQFSRNTNLRIQIPAISICLSYGNAFNFSLPSQLTEANHKGYFTVIDSKINKTIETLFSDLHSNDVIAGCHLRDWSDRMKYFIDYDREHCLQLFEVSQFFMSQKFCRKIEPRKPLMDVYQSDVSSLFIKPSVFLTFDLDENFSFSVAQVYLSPAGRLPDWNNEPSTIANSRKKREITISTRWFISYLLKPPYDTRCSSIPRAQCHSQCLDDSMDNNILPFLVTTGENTTEKSFFIMSYANLVNETFYSDWRRVEKMCEDKCNREMCQYNYTSAVSSGEWPVKDDKLKLSIESPSAATSIMQTNPVIVLYGLLYQVFCCLSFWLGFSIVAINPLTQILSSKMDNMQMCVTKKFIILKRMMKTLIPARYRSKYKSQRKRKYQLTKLSCDQVMSTLTHIAAGIACCGHLVYQMDIYLRHTTYIDVSQDIEWQADYSFFLCLDRAEMLARDRGMNMFNLSVDERTMLLNRSVSEIFADSPSADSIIKGCSHRGVSARRGKLKEMQNVTDKMLFHTSNISECYDYYSVNKMVVGSLVCYSLSPKNLTGWTRVALRGVLNDEKTIYTMTINSSLLTARFSLVAGMSGLFPVTSSEFAPNLYKDARYNHYIISYIKYISTFLPSPYPNRDFTPFMFDRCASTCIKEALKGTNKVFSTRFTEAQAQSNVTFLSYTDRQDKRIPEKLKHVIETCEQECTYFNDYTISEDLDSFPILAPVVGTSTVKPLLDKGLTLFTLKITPILVFTISFNIKISLFEQIINLGSIISIWFGFSAISLASVRRLRKRKISRHHLAEMDEQLQIIRRIYEFA